MYVDTSRISISQFRENPGLFLKWVEKRGGHVWLTRHGRHVAALIPFYQLQALEVLLDQNNGSKALQLEREYKRFRAAKGRLAEAEVERLIDGQMVGGERRTKMMLDMAQRGDSPWDQDPVLLTPYPRTPPNSLRLDDD